MTEHRHTNRLIDSTSPYLLQHAHNPVDWHEWNEEAFKKARDEDKPIFLSIGYAACHWCHVMEHESFESEDVAGVLNEYFVNIKVDREERPDIDELYMAYTVQATKGGGWPMSVWLRPDGSPFFAGTYFPRERFMQVLMSIADTWQHERERITEGADSAQAWFKAWAAGAPKAEGVIPASVPEQVAGLLAKYFDKERGGMSGGGTNKFPPSMAIELMLRVHAKAPQSVLMQAVDTTLDNMARGGIYDHIGGGICRYSTDVEWHVPHFEKMLYDQAMVSDAYLDAYLVTGNKLHAQVASDIFDYVIEDLQSAEGGIYSSRDADSDGLEGKFYIWTVNEVEDALGEEDAATFCAYYDVKPDGNWYDPTGHAPKGPKNVLHMLQSHDSFAEANNMDAGELSQKLRAWREKLKSIRSHRTHPGLDDKVLTGWNGLMIASLARGASILDEPKYRDAAVRAADFILSQLKRNERLLRSARNGKSRLTAYLSDYAFLVDGLLHLYEATFDRRWLEEAVTLTDTAIEHYHDDNGGGFFFTADDGEELIARSKNPRDNAIPSGNSVMAENLLRLSIL
ncbi:MAG: thioredoxin domain-containing protein, partial [Phycisphaerae bacterium]